ncbi:Uncharacterized protein OBRU01_10150, partial [Operophtera brumata]
QYSASGGKSALTSIFADEYFEVSRCPPPPAPSHASVTVIFIFIIIRTVGVSSRDLSESDRANRAAFIQRLLNKEKYLEGRVKLVGGPNKFEGNVYLYHAGRWGAVCDDSWDNAAAQVVCKTFNNSGIATHGGQYGEAIEKFWMDDVVCQGDEPSLPHCIFTGWGSSDCETSEAAGVVCYSKAEAPVELKKPKELLHSVLDVRSTSLRLAGGRNNQEGRVEIFHNGIWGSVCADGWTLYEASAVCRHLALGFAEQALQTDYFGSSKVVLSGVQCQGNESHVAAVICTQNLADLLLETSVIESTAHLQDVMMLQLQCAMEENCVSVNCSDVYKYNIDCQWVDVTDVVPGDYTF